MSNFKNLTPTNGFNFKDLISARQNNYAWSISELGDYIYVGTARNMMLVTSELFIKNLEFPLSLNPTTRSDNAEIWRLRKHKNCVWEKVFTVPDNSNIYGFRYMINYRAYNGNPALYAAGSSKPNSNLKIYKSVNGIDWKETKSTVYNMGNLEGNSSRAMVVFDNKLYIANFDESNQETSPLLYSNLDPEFYPWKLETYPYSTNNYNPNKNPMGSITNMAVFNGHLYLATTTDDKIQIWRTDGDKTEFNKWTLVVDGFGSPANTTALSMGVFKNHLYVSGTKKVPLSWIIPQGCDIIRLDKYDNFEMIVGPDSISGINSGFNNPFNVYGWQIQEYDNTLFISTFDSSIFMQSMLEFLLSYKSELPLPPNVINILIKIYKIIVHILNEFKYPFGFNLYKSYDGVNFSPVILDGLGNRYNYGGRVLYVDSLNDLYIGTANPYQGLEVWKYESCYCDTDTYKMEPVPSYNILINSLNDYFSELEMYAPDIFNSISSLYNNFKFYIN